MPRLPATQAFAQRHSSKRTGWLHAFARSWKGMWEGGSAPLAPVMEEYEQRLLYSADFVTSGIALAGGAQMVEQRLVDAAGNFVATNTGSIAAEVQRHELLIVDAGVGDVETLLQGLNLAGGRSIDVLVLDPAQDGIEQITAALAGRHDLAAVHILSHGSAGQLQLGTTTLDDAQLAARSDEISRWGDALSEQGDMLLYGCDVAAGARGEAFVQHLAMLTRADVAASSNLTGDARRGGDWSLEYAAGQVEASVAFTAAAQGGWQGTLETLVNSSQVANNQTQADVAMNPATGTSVVIWTSDGNKDGDNDGVFAQRFDVSGNPAGGMIQVNTYTADAQNNAAVGMDQNGNFVVVWASDKQDGDKYGIYGQRFDANGVKVGGEFQVNTTTPGNQDSPDIAVAADGTFVVAWRSDQTYGGDIYYRAYDNTGAALTGETWVNTTRYSAQQVVPAIAMDSSKNFMVTWQSDTGGNVPGTGKEVFACIYIYSGSWSALGGEFKANTYTASDQTVPDVAMAWNTAAATGVAVITWTSNGQDGSGLGVYAQCYNYDLASFAALGSEFRVNSTTTNDQISSSVAMGSTGNFMVAWTSKNQDGDNNGVYGQRFDYNSGPNTVSANGAEFLINTTTNNNQQFSSVAMSDAGGAVVVWEGNGVGDNSGIFLRAYVAANNPPTGNPDTAATDQNTTVVGTAPGVLGNDTDPDIGAVLSVTTILPGASGTATAVTAGGVTVNGLYGSLLIRADGSYAYTPNGTTAKALAAGQPAIDVFTYGVSDEKNAVATSTLTVTINGLNDAPTANVDAYAVDKASTLNVGVAAGVLDNDTDVDMNPVPDALSVSEVNGVAGNVGVAFAGTYGTLTLYADGHLDYAPDLGNPAVNALLPAQSLLDSFIYTLSDGKGGTASAAINITISGANTAPVAVDDPGYVLLEDGSLTVTAASGVLANDTDAEGNVLSAQLVTGPAHGVLTLNNDGSFVYTPTLNYSGSDSFTYQASDGSLTSNTATVSLSVTHVNHAPVAMDDIGSVTQDATLTVNAASGVLGNDSDVDASDVLTVTTGAGVTTTSYGTLTLAADGSYTYLADGAASRALALGSTSDDSFSYTVSDGQGGTAIATLTITITGTNDAPVAVADSGGVIQDATLTTNAASGVLGNDTDTDASDVLTVTTGAGVTTTAYGALTLNADGSFSYLANGAASKALALGVTATDSFNYTVSDGNGGTSSATLTITITGTNDAPVAVADSGGVTQDATLTVNAASGVLGNDTDTDASDVLTVTTGAGVTTTAYGTLTLNADGSFSYLANGAASRALALGVTATDSFNYTVSDGNGGTSSATLTITITGTNDAPVALADSGGVTQDATLTVNAASGVLGNDTDIDVGDVLTVSAGTGVTTTAYGTLTLNADGSYTYLADGAASKALALGVSATDSFNYTVSDGNGGTSSATLTITITGTNDAPVAVADSGSVTQDTTLTTNAASGVLGNDTDTDASDVLTVTTGAGVTTTAYGTLTLNADGSFSYLANGAASRALASGVTANDIFAYTASDGQGGTATALLIITITGINDAPIANPDTLSATAGTAVTYTAAALLGNDTDAESSPLTIASVSSGTGGTVLLNPDGTVQFTPATNFSGVASFSYVATDGAAMSAAATVTVNVAPLQVAPAAPPPAPLLPESQVESTPASSAETKEETASAAPAAKMADTSPVIEMMGQADTGAPQLEQKPPVTGLAAEQVDTQTRNNGGMSAGSAVLPVALFGVIGDQSFNFSTGMPADMGTLEAATSATQSRSMIDGLDQLRESVKSDETLEKRIIGSTVAVGGGVSVGYVIWLLRGGVLLSSLLSSLPAWRFIDPLPILSQTGAGEEEEDGESLESMVSREGNEMHEAHKEEKNARV